MNRLPKEFSHPILIGAGEFSTVYRAYQSRVDRIVAIKVFKSQKKEVINKIFSEVTMLGSVSLSCIPHVYDVQYRKCGPMIVMEWIRGVSLNNFLNVNTDRTLKFAIVGKLLDSLSDLHNRDITHGDLKPDNIILSPQGRIYIVDFGFSSETVRQAFKPENIRGTPEYMAPELWSYEKSIDLKRSDIYATGILIKNILGNEFPESIQSSINSNPLNRPSDASELRKLWKEKQNVSFNENQWKIAVSSVTSSVMIGKYIDAVNAFLKKKQFSDAYQVVAEILDESPDNAFALSIIQSVNLTKKRTGLIITLLAVIGSITAIALYLIAFELGRSSDDNEPMYRPNTGINFQSNMLLSLRHSEKNVIVNSLATFRYSKVPSNNDGVIRCIIPASEGLLMVDGKKMATSEKKLNEISCTLSQGTHTFEWNDLSTGIISVETVHLLPFENKRIIIGSVPELK